MEKLNVKLTIFFGQFSLATKGRRGKLAIFNAKYPGFFTICKWAIGAYTVSANKNWTIEMVLLT